MRVRTISGEWLLVHAAHLHSSVDADITVIIEPAQPSRIAPLILNSLGLTLRESDRHRPAPAHLHRQGSSAIELR